MSQFSQLLFPFEVGGFYFLFSVCVKQRWRKDVCLDSGSSTYPAIIIPLDHLHRLYCAFINGVRAAQAGREGENTPPPDLN